jgi:serine protease Do
MTFHQPLTALFGTAATVALVCSVATSASALTGRQINDVARDVTTLIHGENGSHGSGVLISRNNQTYYVLTAAHVVKPNTSYKVVAPDQLTYKVDPKKIVVLPDVDLAVLEFSSDKTYATAKIATANTSQGQDVFVSGWPSLGTVGQAAGGDLIRQFTDGRISGFLPKPYKGYQMIYTNTTRAGMSGGGVFDAAGRLVGIHGLGEKEDVRRISESGITEAAAARIASSIKPGFNFAIPISTFLSKSAGANLYLSLQIERDAAPELGEPYVAAAQVDSRDKISDLDKTLNTVHEFNRQVNGVTNGVRDTQETIRDVQNIFRF